MNTKLTSCDGDDFPLQKNLLYKKYKKPWEQTGVCVWIFCKSTNLAKLNIWFIVQSWLMCLLSFLMFYHKIRSSTKFVFCNCTYSYDDPCLAGMKRRDSRTVQLTERLKREKLSKVHGEEPQIISLLCSPHWTWLPAVTSTLRICRRSYYVLHFWGKCYDDSVVSVFSVI